MPNEEKSSGPPERPQIVIARTRQVLIVGRIAQAVGVVLFVLLVLSDPTEVARGRETWASDVFRQFGVAYDASHHMALFINPVTVFAILIWAIGFYFRQYVHHGSTELGPIASICILMVVTPGVLLIVIGAIGMYAVIMAPSRDSIGGPVVLLGSCIGVGYALIRIGRRLLKAPQ